jgi:hypothetical protein
LRTAASAAALIASLLAGLLPAQAVSFQTILASSYRVSQSRTVDRVAFRFLGGAPGWRAGYVQREVADGSGQAIPLEGRAYFSVTFTPAHASDLKPPFSPTAAERTLTPRLAIVREIKPAGDFEGYVSFGIGLSRRTRYHIAALHNPNRIIIDFIR